METVEDIKTATNLKYVAKSVVVESINLKMILYTEAKKRPRKTQSKHGTRGGEPMLKIPYEQDPYSVIGKYIREHITAIEDIIAVIEIDGITTNQLFMVDMKEENYFIWNNDWYEGEKDVALIDFFPVSEAINPSAQPEQTGKWIPVSERLPKIGKEVLLSEPNDTILAEYHGNGNPEGVWHIDGIHHFLQDIKGCAWMPLPKPYREEGEKE